MLKKKKNRSTTARAYFTMMIYSGNLYVFNVHNM